MPDPIQKDNLWVGFDLGGTKMLSLVFNNDFKIIGRERKKTKPQDSTGVPVERIIKTIRSALDSSGNSGKALSGIGIGAPGTLDLEKGIVLEAPNLGWQKVPLKSVLEKEFSCPVVIINDVDAGIFGEYHLGAAKNVNSVLGIFPGTGIGGGFVYNGNLFTGKTNSCFEIGHFPVVPHGIRCGCGRYGCLETVASRLAIAASAAVAIYRGEAPHLHKLTGTDIATIRSGALAQSIKNGDTAIEQIVRQAAQWLGIVIGGLINVLLPEIVVLGGGLVEAMPEIYLQEVKFSCNKHVMPSFAKSFKIVTASLGDDATASGAAAWAKKITGNIRT